MCFWTSIAFAIVLLLGPLTAKDKPKNSNQEKVSQSIDKVPHSPDRDLSFNPTTKR